MSSQQTVLRVYSNLLDDQGVLSPYEFLDLYSSIPIKISKSVAELQDISKKNSDYSIGLQLPGSKNNNRFFESFFNVDSQSLFFNATKRVQADVLLNDQLYFSGYMRLNKVNVLNSKVEYDVTLYSSVGDIFGKIGNNLLRDLDFTDTEYEFNHTFSQSAVTSTFYYSNFLLDQEKPFPYFYPIVHNGYNYYNSSGATLPNLSGNTTGATLEDQTRLYTSTSPIGAWSTLTGATAAGVQEYFINSPRFGLRDNQLKPALSIYSLIQLIFKTYGYKIKSDFFNTPWMKTLYLYGYYSSELTKFSYKINSIQTLPLDGVELRNTGTSAVVTKRGTGIPCYCLSDINISVTWSTPPSVEEATIKAGTSGYTYTGCCTLDTLSSYDVPAYRFKAPTYLPLPVGTVKTFVEGDYVDFSLVIDQNIKQIDILSSIAKKFNLVFIPDPENSNQIIVEPFDYYMGTGQIYDWTPKISFDKGFTVEPALNFIESSLLLTDLEDEDEGNRIFKNQNNRIYGQNNIYNPTDFKSQEKKIDTIFSPELIRKWDDNIGLPLGINYAATNETSSYDNQVRWLYKGVKSKPKLFYWLGANNPFIDQVGEVFDDGSGYYDTYTVKVAPSNYTGNSVDSYNQIPVISHTMPMGLSDENKINNDSLSILFNSELPVNVGVQTFNTYTENDCYNTFYSNRITNLYNSNTRLLTGNFELKYSDIQNLSPKDIIKINEQYFIVNKINDFNLTNRELTKVELLQYNSNPQTYVDRYFSYYYCDDPSICYKFKTDFTNPNLLDTNFLWSVYYDRQVGSLSGQTSGFTSSFRVFNATLLQVNYVPYTMYEIDENTYNTATCNDWNCDTLRNFIYQATGTTSPIYSLSTFWENSGSTKTGVNVWNSCTDFYSTATTYGIRTQSSTYYGTIDCPCSENIGSGFNAFVQDIEIQSNDKILVGGSFTQYSGITTDGGLCRLNTDLTLDTSFVYSDETSSSNAVKDILIQPNQKILRIDLNNLRRLNTDGSYDTGFNTVYWDTITGETQYEEVMGIQSDGKIIVGGQFTSFTSSGTTGTTTSTKKYIQRLNTDGTIDTTFNSGGTGFTLATGFTYLSGVQSLLVLPDDKILVVGKFSQYNGIICDCLIKLNSNGSVDNTFTVDTSPSDNFGFLDVGIQSDGKILVGGIDGYPSNPTIYLGYTVRGLFRLNSNGTFDTSFPYNVYDGNTWDIRVLSDDSMYIGGEGNSYSGVTVENIFKLTSNGTLDTSFNTGTGFNSGVYDIEIDINNRVLAGGNFTIYDGETSNRFIILNRYGNKITCG